MPVQRHGDGWTVTVENSVMVWEFLPGMELSAFGEQAYPVYEELLDEHSIDGMVTAVELEDPFSGEVFDIWERSAQRADAAGIERWAVVAEGVKQLSLRSKVDAGDLETLTTEDRPEAVEWAAGN